MPDYTDFLVTRQPPSSITMPTWRIELRVVDAAGTVIRDFTGVNALTFPNVLATLTTAEQQDLVERIAHELIQRRLRQ